MSSVQFERRKLIPLGDRQVAMSLLLELSLQRGTLSHILDAILLLLRLSHLPADKNRRVPKSEGEEKAESLSGGEDQEVNEKNFPLVPFLRRISTVPTPPTPYLSLKAPQEVSVAVSCLQSSSFHSLCLSSVILFHQNVTWNV